MRDPIELAQEVLRVEGQAVIDVAQQIDESFRAVVRLFVECRGHVIVSGVGATGMIGRRLAHQLCCVGCPSLFLHAGDSLHGSSGSLTTNDVLFLLSKTGETTETSKLAEIARSRGTPIVAVTAERDSTLGRAADVVLQVKTPDKVDPYGLMSLGSSLAMAAVCDALVAAVLQRKQTPLEDFVSIHPGGIVSHLADRGTEKS